jgi:hypothetical protein
MKKFAYLQNIFKLNYIFHFILFWIYRKWIKIIICFIIRLFYLNQSCIVLRTNKLYRPYSNTPKPIRNIVPYMNMR